MPGAGDFFDHLLVTPLHRAVALAEMHGVAVAIREHLELDVARVLEEFLHVDLVVAERGQRFGARDRHGVEQRGVAVDDAHAAAAAAGRGFDDHGIADVVREPRVDLRDRRASGPSEPGTHGTPAARIVLMADTLSPIRRIVSGFGPDEDEAALLDALGEIRVLREEAVAGMNRDGSP